MENFSSLIEEFARTIISLLGFDPRDQSEESMFFEALHLVMSNAVPRERRYRPGLVYNILVFFFGHRQAHTILMRYNARFGRR
jgi:hypothetical protein